MLPTPTLTLDLPGSKAARAHPKREPNEIPRHSKMGL